MRKVLMISFVLVISVTAFGGSLEPSGGPGPTMKTLDEVEPRIPISQADIPKTINTSGSYYLTEDVTAVGTAITVSVDDVTIDLSGYTIAGPGSGTNYGININGSLDNIEIRNGTIRGFEYGITQSSTVCTNTRVIDMRVLANTERGISLIGSGNLVKNCIVSENGTGGGGGIYACGIKVGKNSTVSGNLASNNGTSSTTTYVYGIAANEGSMVTGNTVTNNGDSATGSYIYGISTGSGSTVTHNTSYDNGNLADSNVYGIYAGFGSTVTHNTSYGNGDSATGNVVYGIYANGGSTVTHNTSYDNGNSADGNIYGIYASSGSTVTHNTARRNGNSAGGNVYGIYANISSTVIGNTAYYNGYSAGIVYGIYLIGYSLVDQNTAYNNGVSASSVTNMDLGIASCVYGINVAP